MRDIVVVSDLHLGRGKNPASGRYYRLEAFFFDDDFASFCRWLCAESDAHKSDFVLVLNGDTFDLLRIEPATEAAHTARERRFGPVMTPDVAAETVADICRGHCGFVDGVAYVLEHGHSVVMIPGNHDHELQWAPVQAAVRDAVAEVVRKRAGEGAVARAIDALMFEPWFYYEKDRIWIEHGSQYDKENAFDFWLRGGLVDVPDTVLEAERDVPMGTFFQRYLYNAFGSITFIVPSSRANSRYFRWLLLNRPRLLARVARSHFPFFLQVLRRIAKAGGGTTELADVHGRELDGLAERSGLGDDLRAIDAIKTAHGNAARVARGIIMNTLKVTILAVLLAILVNGSWFLGVSAIDQIDAGFGLKAVLFIALNFLFLSTILGTTGYVLLRPPPAPPSRPARRAAEKIAKRLDVPIVTFGHSHDEVVFRLGANNGADGWYYNTGTWVAVFTHDQLLPRERVQYTFLRVRGTNAELLHWSPGRGEAVPVVLLEDDRWERPPDASAS